MGRGGILGESESRREWQPQRRTGIQNRSRPHRAGNPKGKNFEFTLALADSKIFRGDDETLEPTKKAVRKERRIFVYVPAAYKDGSEAPILVTHDWPGKLS